MFSSSDAGELYAAGTVGEIGRLGPEHSRRVNGSMIARYAADGREAALLELPMHPKELMALDDGVLLVADDEPWRPGRRLVAAAAFVVRLDRNLDVRWVRPLAARVERAKVRLPAGVLIDMQGRDLEVVDLDGRVRALPNTASHAGTLALGPDGSVTLSRGGRIEHHPVRSSSWRFELGSTASALAWTDDERLLVSIFHSESAKILGVLRESDVEVLQQGRSLPPRERGVSGRGIVALDRNGRLLRGHALPFAPELEPAANGGAWLVEALGYTTRALGRVLPAPGNSEQTSVWVGHVDRELALTRAFVLHPLADTDRTAGVSDTSALPSGRLLVTASFSNAPHAHERSWPSSIYLMRVEP